MQEPVAPIPVRPQIPPVQEKMEDTDAILPCCNAGMPRGNLRMYAPLINLVHRWMRNTPLGNVLKCPKCQEEIPIEFLRGIDKSLADNYEKKRESSGLYRPKVEDMP